MFVFAGKYKDNEAIEFSFDLNKDVPEDVAQEMVCIILTSGDEYERGVGMIFQSQLKAVAGLFKK